MKFKHSILLDSVGTYYDPATKLTAACSWSLIYDHAECVHVNDCSKEWYDALSEDDLKRIKLGKSKIN